MSNSDIFVQYGVTVSGHVYRKATGRIMAEFIGRDGYVRVNVKGKTRLLHRIVAERYLPKISGKDQVNHIDGNKTNNAVSNLEWCTRAENMKHASTTGLIRRPKGIANGRCILTPEQVEFIKEHYKPGDKEYGATPLGKRFGVAYQTISAVATGQNWKTS